MAAPNPNLNLWTALAAIPPDWPLIQQLISDSDLTTTDTVGNTILHRLATLGHVETMQLALRHGADVNAVDAEGQTPLILAVTVDDLAMVEILVQAGADLLHCDNQGAAAIHHAIDKLAVLDCLIKAGADVNQCHAYHGGSPLIIWASSQPNDKQLALASMQLLVTAGADINQPGRGSRGILGYAIEYWSGADGAELFEWLLQQRANPLSRSPGAPEAVVRMNKPELLPALIRAGIDPSSLLTTALYNEQWQQWLELLVNLGSNLKKGDLFNEALDIGKVDQCHWLITAGVPVTDEHLWQAMSHYNEQMVELVLQQGISPEILDSKSRTPLVWCLRKRFEAGIRVLLRYGATVTSNAFDQAFYSDYYRLLALLLPHLSPVLLDWYAARYHRDRHLQRLLQSHRRFQALPPGWQRICYGVKHNFLDPWLQLESITAVRFPKKYQLCCLAGFLNRGTRRTILAIIAALQSRLPTELLFVILDNVSTERIKLVR